MNQKKAVVVKYSFSTLKDKFQKLRLKYKEAAIEANGLCENSLMRDGKKIIAHRMGRKTGSLHDVKNKNIEEYNTKLENIWVNDLTTNKRKYVGLYDKMLFKTRELKQKLIKLKQTARDQQKTAQQNHYAKKLLELNSFFTGNNFLNNGKKINKPDANNNNKGRVKDIESCKSNMCKKSSKDTREALTDPKSQAGTTKKSLLEKGGLFNAKMLAFAIAIISAAAFFSIDYFMTQAVTVQDSATVQGQEVSTNPDGSTNTNFTTTEVITKNIALTVLAVLGVSSAILVIIGLSSFFIHQMTKVKSVDKSVNLVTQHTKLHKTVTEKAENGLTYSRELRDVAERLDNIEKSLIISENSSQTQNNDANQERVANDDVPQSEDGEDQPSQADSEEEHLLSSNSPSFRLDSNSNANFEDQSMQILD